MDYNDIKPISDAYYRRLSRVSLSFKRYLYDQINWNARLIGIKGARGVGKTTMLLQHIKETFENPEDALYVSLDNLWFQTHTVEELVDYLYARGVIHLYFDEVHKYPKWSVLLKNLYDNYPDLNIVYTGSAMLAIDNSISDLSRRQTLYSLHGLSFREYLQYEGIADLKPMAFDELKDNHVSRSMEICSKVKVLKYFDNYLKMGYYPYYKEAGIDYLMRLGEVVRLVIESDVPATEDVMFATLQKMKKLMMVVAETVPMEINVNKLTAQLETTRDICLKMLYSLDRAGLLNLLTEKVKDYKHLFGPKKIYLNNTNIMFATSQNISEGTLRETFFANQLGASHSLTMPKQGDFLLDGKYLFEVGGPRKTFDQIADIPNSYLAIDDIEVGSGNRIPLWLLGMEY